MLTDTDTADIIDTIDDMRAHGGAMDLDLDRILHPRAQRDLDRSIRDLQAWGYRFHLHRDVYDRIIGVRLLEL